MKFTEIDLTRGAVTLPGSLERTTIADIPLGDEAYVVPWALEVGPRGDCWIHTTHSYASEPHGTRALYLKRVERGFLVDFAAVDWFKWNKARHPVTGDEYMPVRGIGW